MTMNTPPTDSLDPHNLVAQGEALATTAELVKLLGVSRGVLEPLLYRELAGRVRSVRTPPGGGKWRYAVADARAAIAPLLPALEEARMQRAAVQARDQADSEKRKAERQAAHAAHVARKEGRVQRCRTASPTQGRGKPAAASSQPTSSRRDPPARAVKGPETRTPPSPEVFVRRKFNAG